MVPLKSPAGFFRQLVDQVRRQREGLGREDVGLQELHCPTLLRGRHDCERFDAVGVADVVAILVQTADVLGDYLRGAKVRAEGRPEDIAQFLIALAGLFELVNEIAPDLLRRSAHVLEIRDRIRTQIPDVGAWIDRLYR